MVEKKQQHTIPQCYLKAWCDPRTPPGQHPYIWRISRDGSERREKSPEKFFHFNGQVHNQAAERRARPDNRETLAATVGEEGMTHGVGKMEVVRAVPPGLLN